MNDTSVQPKSRREMWLQIALAVAEGLPAPERLSVSDRDLQGTPYMYVTCDRHDEARAWADHFGRPMTATERTDLGNAYVEAMAMVHGWRVHIQGVEPIGMSEPTTAERDLAAEVVAAIETAGAALSTVGGAA